MVFDVLGQEKNNNFNFVSPLSMESVVVGNFGEPRERHFHTGIDYATYTEGKNIIAVEDGFVSRILVSPFGYGQALYVTHPNGYTSVYGHLSKFSPEIESFIRKIQYDKQSFAIDTSLSPDKFIVKKGSIIALSGDTGYSEGPHLHFEIRETATDMPVNIVNKFYFYKDNIAPEITFLVIYPLNKNSFIDGKNEKKIVELKKNSAGIYIANAAIPKVSGTIGFGLAYVDRMNGTTNRYGAQTVKLYNNDELIYHSEIDKLSFDNQRAKNSMFDYEIYLKDSKHVQKLFIEPGNNLDLYIHSVNDGRVYIPDSFSDNFKITVTDFNKNTSQVLFSLTAENNEYKSVTDYSGLVLKYNEALLYSNEGFRLEFDSASVYHDCDLDIEKVTTWKYSDVYKVGKDYFAVKNDFKVMFFLDDNLLKIKDKLYIGRNSNDDFNFLMPQICQNWLYSYSSYFGKFYLWIDTIPPAIIGKNIKDGYNLSNKNSIVIEIKDEGSGIKKYDMFINNKWVLGVYNPRKKTLTYFFDENMPVSDKYKLKVVVTDRLQNTSELVLDFIK